MRKNLIKKIIFALLSVVLFTACGTAPKLKAGDAVLTDWYQGNWHAARLIAECKDTNGNNADGNVESNTQGETGWTVDFNDNFYDSGEGSDPVCFTADKIVLDAAPSASMVKVGNTLLAEWIEDSYYVAKVEKINGEEYSVKFLTDNWESQVRLDQLRLLPEVKSGSAK